MVELKREQMRNMMTCSSVRIPKSIAGQDGHVGKVHTAWHFDDFAGLVSFICVALQPTACRILCRGAHQQKYTKFVIPVVPIQEECSLQISCPLANFNLLANGLEGAVQTELGRCAAGEVDAMMMSPPRQAGRWSTGDLGPRACHGIFPELKWY